MTKIEVYYCEKKTHCNWKCFALDAYGLGFGIIPSGHDAWRIWHDKECGGKLIQAEIVTPDSTPPSDKREQIAKHLYEYRYSAGYWDTRMTDGDKWKWRNEADQILKLMEGK